MTAPIQEPSVQRNFQGTAWATRQLARRPSPGGGAAPVPWCRLGSGGNTATPDTWTRCNFSQAMMYNTTPGDVYTITDTGTRFTVTLEAAGLYLVDFTVSWTNFFVEPSTIHAQGTPTAGDWLYEEWYALQDTRRQQPAGAEQGPYDLIQHLCAMAWKSDPSVDNTTFDPAVHQMSSSNRSFDAYSLRFMYFGEMGDEGDWVFETT